MVINRLIYDGVDTPASVELVDGCAINSSMSNLGSCLEIQNGSSSLARNLVNIDLVERIWTKNDFGVRNLGHEESTQKVSVAFINETIDNIGFINHGLKVSALVTKEAAVGRWVVHDDASLGLSFENKLVGGPVLFLKTICHMSSISSLFELSAVSRDAIWHLDNAFPRSHIHAVFSAKPVHWLL